MMSARLAAVSLILIFSFAECAAGSCLSYGHSCWGAHGKRNGNVPLRNRQNTGEDNPDWFISRLMTVPLEISSANERQFLKDHKVHHPESAQILNSVRDGDNQEQQQLQQDLEDFSQNDDALYLDDPILGSRLNGKNFQFLKLMDRKIGKQHE